MDKAVALVAAAHVDPASLDLEKSPALHRCGVRIAGPYCVSAILVGFFGFGSTERGERVAMAALSSSTTVAARCAKGAAAVTRAESTRALCSSAWQVGCCPVEQLRCRAKIGATVVISRRRGAVVCASPAPTTKGMTPETIPAQSIARCRVHGSKFTCGMCKVDV